MYLYIIKYIYNYNIIKILFFFKMTKPTYRHAWARTRLFKSRRKTDKKEGVRPVLEPAKFVGHIPVLHL